MDPARQHLHLPRRQLGVDGLVGPSLHRALDGYDVFGPQPLRDRRQGLIITHDDLRNAASVADVKKRHAAQVADPVNPAKQCRAATDIGRPKVAAGMRPGQIAKRLRHVDDSGSRFNRSRFRVPLRDSVRAATG